MNMEPSNKTLADLTREDWFKLCDETPVNVLSHFGLAKWNEVNDLDSNMPWGTVLYLIPHAAYNFIPPGFPLVTINGKHRSFCKKAGEHTQPGETDDDHRSGYLAFGILRTIVPNDGCKRCGQPKQDWQVYCGAACVAQAGA